MPPIINAQELAKRFGVAPLFESLSLTVSEGDRIGVIGPNGSGKSTVLRILAGSILPDRGEVALRKRARVSLVEQNSEFSDGATVGGVIAGALQRAGVSEAERGARSAETLGRAGFIDLDALAATLSGGWRKRLAIVAALVEQPDVLLLDEPTNHLDLAGIKWLEGILQSTAFACVVVSHDRYLLEAFASDIVEINRVYPEGLLRVKGNYSRFLETREDFLYAQGQRQESLANRVRSEVEWLRRGAKARTSKSKARIGKANDMIGELADLSARTRVDTAQIDFSASGRKTKKLIDMDQIAYEVGGRELFRGLDFTLKAGMRVGLVGPNGSGKTTLLRLLKGELQPTAGTCVAADHLRIVYFDQNRRLPADVTLRRALAPDGESVIYQDRLVHVASWAARFLFSGEDLNQPVGRLSGGERARVLIAQLMLQPADVLLLDEPTNDLDIPTLEILEASLLEYPGALVLVTHDRYMMDRVSTMIVGLDGRGASGQFADYAQWDEWQRKQGAAQISEARTADSRPAAAKKRLSYLEAREYATIEQRVAEAEEGLRLARLQLEDPAIASDGPRLLDLSSRIELAENLVDTLYARWSELEAKNSAK